GRLRGRSGLLVTGLLVTARVALLGWLLAALLRVCLRRDIGLRRVGRRRRGAGLVLRLVAGVLLGLLSGVLIRRPPGRGGLRRGRRWRRGGLGHRRLGLRRGRLRRGGLGGRGGGLRRRRAVLVDHGQLGADLDGLVLGDRDAPQDSGDRGGDLGVDLV